MERAAQLTLLELQGVSTYERFNRCHGGGVSAVYRQGGYTLTVAETEAPVARLKPTGQGDTMRVYYWSHRDKWANAGPLGGVILPLDDALKTIASSLLQNRRLWLKCPTTAQDMVP